MRWNDLEGTRFEGWMSRGDRRIADIIERAWELGCQFDAWQDGHKHRLWLQAFDELTMNPDFYNHRTRGDEEIFPWEHIDVAVHKKFLLEDYKMSLGLEERVDCRDKCFACGILPKFTKIRAQTEEMAWECPPVKPIKERMNADKQPNVLLMD